MKGFVIDRHGVVFDQSKPYEPPSEEQIEACAQWLRDRCAHLVPVKGSRNCCVALKHLGGDPRVQA